MVQHNSSILVIVLVLGGEPVKIVYFLAYFAIELAIVKNI